MENYNGFRHSPSAAQLVIVTPKSLLRHPLAKSSLKELDSETRFIRFYPETNTSIFNGANNESVKRLVLCTGKVYYDLIAARDKAGLKDVAIARIEQISPFPFDLVHQHSDVCLQRAL